jgi:hypothetical protein
MSKVTGGGEFGDEERQALDPVLTLSSRPICQAPNPVPPLSSRSISRPRVPASVLIRDASVFAFCSCPHVEFELQPA